MSEMTTLAQNLPNSPVQTTGGGGFWGGASNFLNSAAGIYAQYEAYRASRNPGVVYVEKAYENPVPTGAAVEVEEGKQQPGATSTVAKDNVNIAGLSMPRAVAYIGGGLVALLVIKKAGLL